MVGGGAAASVQLWPGNLLIRNVMPNFLVGLWGRKVAKVQSAGQISGKVSL